MGRFLIRGKPEYLLNPIKTNTKLPGLEVCVHFYSKIMNYCDANNLKPEEVNVYLAPFMSIAGDHAHNDLWGLKALAEGNDLANVKINTNEFSWRERLEKIGFKVDETFEAHSIKNADADHGIKDGCGIKSLGSYPEIRKIWVDHLYENWNNEDAWENGEAYQPGA